MRESAALLGTDSHDATQNDAALPPEGERRQQPRPQRSSGLLVPERPRGHGPLVPYIGCLACLWSTSEFQLERLLTVLLGLSALLPQAARGSLSPQVSALLP